MQKGDIFEAQVSRHFHCNSIPTLVSSLILREKNLGQIDIAYLEKKANKTWVLKIIETKSSLYPSRNQMQRLRGTQDYLSKVLEASVILEVKFCKKVYQTLDF